VRSLFRFFLRMQVLRSTFAAAALTAARDAGFPTLQPCAPAGDSRPRGATPDGVSVRRVPSIFLRAHSGHPVHAPLRSIQSTPAEQHEEHTGAAPPCAAATGGLG